MSGLEALRHLVGAWGIGASHPMLEGAVQGRIEVEWLEGERFLLHRSRNDHPKVPDSISVIGDFEDVGLAMHYFDSRGVHRVYRMSFRDGVWKLWRDAGGLLPPFRRPAQRGRQRARRAVGELSADNSAWTDDWRSPTAGSTADSSERSSAAGWAAGTIPAWLISMQHPTSWPPMPGCSTAAASTCWCEQPRPTASSLRWRPTATPAAATAGASSPTSRDSRSQPGPALHAFEVFEDIAPATSPRAVELCDWLETVTLPDGGLPFVVPVGSSAGCAPFWANADPDNSSLQITPS